MAAYYYDIDILCSVPKTSFYPIPKVDSTLVRLVPKKERNVAENEQLFFNLVKVLFSQRRKMIKNTLEKHFYKLQPTFKEISKENIKAFISELAHPNQRPEELSLDQFIELADSLNQAFSD
jgi:16S rRNA (adenine1518-N6/adenine1519-N6)-dimethyltransferase